MSSLESVGYHHWVKQFWLCPKKYPRKRLHQLTWKLSTALQAQLWEFSKRKICGTAQKIELFWGAGNYFLHLFVLRQRCFYKVVLWISAGRVTWTKPFSFTRQYILTGKFSGLEMARKGYHWSREGSSLRKNKLKLSNQTPGHLDAPMCVSETASGGTSK